ncbi:short-chain dehydrogenase [Burkholderia ubonensis]|uniref:SDR family oxidoreductase n=1 Tax=Burkholderia ubonensis TaxID=101571 RepID=UPI00075EA546|nr:SDR family oxidoreductase [Burkholderia ubonensis]KVM59108.1 short-chain dehydrogenase [Burkholderia ubonensis]
MSNQFAKIALVTGATRGIGLETARQLGASGVRVLLAGRDRERAEEAAGKLRDAGHDVVACQLDVTDAVSITNAAAAVEREYGRLDILVNNAGIRIEAYGKRPSEQPLHQWRETFETNLFGIVSVTQAFLPLIRKADAGRIVNVSSLLASLGTHSDPGSYAYSEKFKSLPAYSASKSAVNSWTVHLAFELRDTLVKVNAVHPGYTRTDMNDGDGMLDVEAGASTSVAMALLDRDGPTGSFIHMGEPVRW